MKTAPAKDKRAPQSAAVGVERSAVGTFGDETPILLDNFEMSRALE